MSNIPTAAEALTALLVDDVARTDANRRSSVAIDVAILTLLIDAKITTIEGAAQRQNFAWAGAVAAVMPGRCRPHPR